MPALFVAVNVYIVVTDGETEAEPETIDDCTPTPLLIETDVAPDTFQDNVAGLPWLTDDGDAVNEDIVGAAGGGGGGGGGVPLLTVTVVVAVATPTLFVAVNVYVVVIAGETDTEPLAKAV